MAIKLEPFFVIQQKYQYLRTKGGCNRYVTFKLGESDVWYYSGPRIDMHLQMEEEEEGVNYQYLRFGSLRFSSGLGLIKLWLLDRLSTPLCYALP